MDGWIWMGGWTGRQMDGWIDGKTLISAVQQRNIYVQTKMQLDTINTLQYLSF
jgi:hypothetical protein